ncbi:MAG TPA: SDR family NAD(P)-dependent oxidoreductase [Candidatus Binataceae bacterium]
MAEMRFDGRVAIVTGAGNGLGRTYAHFLASKGARVIVNDLGLELGGAGAPTEAPARTVVAEIEAAGGAGAADTHDVVTGAQAIINVAMETFGRIDILINNAGFAGFSSFAETALDDFERVLGVHLLGSLRVTRAAWPHMLASRYGRIVNVASSALLGMDGLASYGTAKAGIVGLTRALAIDGAAHNIKCNALCPFAATRASSSMPPGEIRDWLMRDMKPERVAPAMGLLVHERCPVTGEVIVAGGGRVANMFFAETRGYVNPELTMEALLDNFDRVLDRNGHQVVVNSNDSSGFCASVLRSPVI